MGSLSKLVKKRKLDCTHVYKSLLDVSPKDLVLFLGKLNQCTKFG